MIRSWNVNYRLRNLNEIQFTSLISFFFDLSFLFDFSFFFCFFFNHHHHRYFYLSIIEYIYTFLSYHRVERVPSIRFDRESRRLSSDFLFKPGVPIVRTEPAKERTRFGSRKESERVFVVNRPRLEDPRTIGSIIETHGYRYFRREIKIVRMRSEDRSVFSPLSMIFLIHSSTFARIYFLQLIFVNEVTERYVVLIESTQDVRYSDLHNHHHPTFHGYR